MLDLEDWRPTDHAARASHIKAEVCLGVSQSVSPKIGMVQASYARWVKG